MSELKPTGLTYDTNCECCHSNKVNLSRRSDDAGRLREALKSVAVLINRVRCGPKKFKKNRGADCLNEAVTIIAEALLPASPSAEQCAVCYGKPYECDKCAANPNDSSAPAKEDEKR